MPPPPPSSLPLLVSSYQKGHTLEQTIESLPEYHGLTEIKEVPNSAKEGHSPIFRSEHSYHHGLASMLHPDYKCVVDIYLNNVERNPNSNAWAHIPASGSDYQYITFKESKRLIDHFGSALVELVQTNNLTSPIISIYSHNRYEWLMSDLTCQMNSLPTVSLYDTLGPESTKHILQITQTPIILTVNSKIDNLVNLIHESAYYNNDDLSSLKIIITFDPVQADQLTRCQDAGVKLLSLTQLLKRGETLQPHFRPNLPTPDTITTVTFTSGTSSVPKGVELTQSMFMTALLNSAAVATKKLLKLRGTARIFAMLPLAHILERLDIYASFYHAVCVYFPKDGSNPKTFLDDLKKARPHVFITVPRVLMKIENAVKHKIHTDSSFKVKLLKNAINWKMQQYKLMGHTKTNPSHWFHDTILNGFKKTLGFDSLLFFVVGSAALPAGTSLFIKALLNHNLIYTGYGSTEACCGVTMNLGSDIHENHVGLISITTEFRIKDRPELEYVFGENRAGEIMFRGPQVFKNYFRDEQATKKAFDEDGFYISGDIVQLTDDGNIKILDRANNFFKLSHGEFISPERIETVYLEEYIEWIGQMWVIGRSHESFLVGFLFIDRAQIIGFLQSYHVQFNEENLQSVINSLPFKRLFFNKVLNDPNGKLSELKGFEMIYNFKIYTEEFLTIDNDTLTTTLKVRRHKAKAYFKNDIDELYTEGSLLQNKAKF